MTNLKTIEVRDFRSGVGKVMREIRNAKGMTQKEMGDLVRCGQTCISTLELGQRPMRVDFIKEFADANHITLSEFFRKVEKLLLDEENDIASGHQHYQD